MLNKFDTTFQYLAYQKNSPIALEWIPGNASFIPDGAVIGGTSPDGYPLYIILNYQAGNYDARNLSAEVNGESFIQWSWLVLTYGINRWYSTYNYMFSSTILDRYTVQCRINVVQYNKMLYTSLQCAVAGAEYKSGINIESS